MSGDLGYNPGSALYVLRDLGQVPDHMWASAFSATKAMGIVLKVIDFGNGLPALNSITNRTSGKSFNLPVPQFLPL